MINHTPNVSASRNAFQNTQNLQNQQPQNQRLESVNSSNLHRFKNGNIIQQKRMQDTKQTKIPVYNYIPNNQYLQSCRKSRFSQRPDLANKNFNEKLKCLRKVKYINQLAQLDYDEKLTELHTKYSKTSKNVSLKKIKAKNQIAEFIDQEDQWDLQFDQIIDYKHGNSKNQGFHFQKQEIKNQYYFCERCDQITNDYPQAHSYLCKDFKGQLEMKTISGQQYRLKCLKRIFNDLSMINEPETQWLKYIVQGMQANRYGKGQAPEQVKRNIQALEQIQRNTKITKIVGGICKKLKQLY